jgi:hypothetical protein
MNHDMRCYFYLVFGLVMGFKVDSLIKDPATRGRDEDGVVGFPSFISQPTTSAFLEFGKEALSSSLMVFFQQLLDTFTQFGHESI